MLLMLNENLSYIEKCVVFVKKMLKEPEFRNFGNMRKEIYAH